jgi:tRNA(fMet)-specific endonuclease VapC
MYLLDTNILSYFFKKQGNVVQRMHERPAHLMRVSSIVILEIEFGLHRSSNPTKHRTQLDWILRHFTIAPFDADAAQATGLLRHTLEAAGQPIGTYDLFIAGTALAHNLTLVTRNTREFERVPGLKIENWYD